jgi:hypothetical protein
MEEIYIPLVSALAVPLLYIVLDIIVYFSPCPDHGLIHYLLHHFKQRHPELTSQLPGMYTHLNIFEINQNNIHSKYIFQTKLTVFDNTRTV